MSSSSPHRLRIAGTYSGAIDLDLDTWTLPMLRSEVARRSGRAVSSDCISLISGGKVLRDGDDVDRNLLQVGLKNNAKVLASAVSPDRGKAVNDEAERSQRLARLRAAALAVAGRHAGGAMPEEDFNMELENQNGQKVDFGSETDRRSLMMGLMLHTNAKTLIKKKQYQDAVDVLSMAEEAFSLCDPKLTDMIDNLPILELDTVWCYFMLRDISCLSMAGMRLSKARKGFERAHGKDSTRFRQLQEGRQAELAIYLRLELLEGVVSFYSGNPEESRKALSSAQSKYMQLQVPDEALSLLMNMGYKEQAAKRALRMTGQDIQNAVEFLVEERAKKVRRHEEDLQRQAELREQKKYGKTPLNKAVDLEALKGLETAGYEKDLAAEALRLNENDIFKAIDDLTNPEKKANIEYQVGLRNRGRASRSANIEALVALGYDRSAVLNAVDSSRTKEDAMRLLAEVFPGVVNQQFGSSSSVQDQSSNSMPGVQVGPSVEAATGVQVGPSVEAATGDHVDNNTHLDDQDEVMEEERDEEMEGELAKEVKADPFEDYDLEVSIEGEAILEYLALLDSKTNCLEVPI